MEIREYSAYVEAEVLALYESVGWTSYTDKPGMLKNAFAGSLKVLAAYEDDALIGIIRLVGDGHSIVYIQDLIVRPEHQHHGVGTALIKAALELYPHVYQTVLMTDDSEKTKAFYAKAGFYNVADIGCTGFTKINRQTRICI